MKRMALFALTCLLTGALLTGCRSNSSGTETMPSTVPATKAPTEAPTQPATKPTQAPTRPSQGTDSTRPSGKGMPNPMDRGQDGLPY